MPNDALVVVQKGDNSLDYHGLHTGAGRYSLALDPYPRELALSSDGRRYVCHFGVALLEDLGDDGRTVAVLDLPRPCLVATLQCGEHRRPYGVAVDLAGAVYVFESLHARVHRTMPYKDNRRYWPTRWQSPLGSPRCVC